MPLWILDIFGWILAHWRLALAIAITAIVLFLALTSTFCGGDSKLEKQIDNRIPEIINRSAEVNVTNREANIAKTDANTVKKERDRIKKQRKVNVTVDEANRNRCIAFPGPDCQ